MWVILLISPEPWSAHAVSKHHYAMMLAARGYRVLFLDPPEPSLPDLTMTPVAGLPDLFIVRGPRVMPGLRFYPPRFKRWLEARWLARLERLTGAAIDTIWLFENSRFYDLRFAGSRLKVYHQVDLNQNFHPATAAATADICFCVSDFILQRLLPHNPRVFKIHHGVAVSGSPAMLSATQMTRFERPGPHAVYIGNLDIAYLDVDLLTEAVRRFPAVSFHFVGGYNANGPLRTQTADLPNVIWWGRVASDLIPVILDRADVLLLTYRAVFYREQLANPHKVMEYLASGKVTVATYTDEYKDKKHLLEMADEREDYLAKLAHVLANLDDFNRQERQAVRKAFAQANTYPIQLDRILQLLRQHGLITD